MTRDEVMAALASEGKEQTRKTYRRHGMPEPMFGVSYAFLGTLKKRIKVDHALALALWATDNGDARALAPMIADAKVATRDEVEAWVRSVRWAGGAGAVADFVARCPFAAACAEAWTRDDGEWVARAGWQLVALDAGRDDDRPDAAFRPWLARVEAEVHAAKNRVRDAMMGALIAIGGRNDGLAEEAIAAAQRIGHVEVDHGDTACETPDPVAYVRKVRAHKAAKAARALAKAK